MTWWEWVEYLERNTLVLLLPDPVDGVRIEFHVLDPEDCE